MSKKAVSKRVAPWASAIVNYHGCRTMRARCRAEGAVAVVPVCHVDYNHAGTVVHINYSVLLCTCCYSHHQHHHCYVDNLLHCSFLLYFFVFVIFREFFPFFLYLMQRYSLLPCSPRVLFLNWGGNFPKETGESPVDDEGWGIKKIVFKNRCKGAMS